MSKAAPLLSTIDLELARAAAAAARECLSIDLTEGQRGVIVRALGSSGRVATTFRDVELTLIEAMVPVVRAEVESGRVALAAGDDYLKTSARLVRAFAGEWLAPIAGG